MQRKASYLWIVPGFFLFPALHLLIFLLRFNRIPDEMWGESLVFAPIGLLSVAALVYFLRKEENKNRRKKIVLCFLLAIPFAWISSLMIGLFNTSPIVVTIAGTVPMILSILFGRKIK